MKLTNVRHEASRGLFATAELLVLYPFYITTPDGNGYKYPRAADVHVNRFCEKSQLQGTNILTDIRKCDLSNSIAERLLRNAR